MGTQQEGLSFASELEHLKIAHSLLKAEDSHMKTVAEEQ